MFKLKKIREIVVITADLKGMIQTFCDYGGWTQLFTKKLPPSVFKRGMASEKSNVSQLQAPMVPKLSFLKLFDFSNCTFIFALKTQCLLKKQTNGKR